MRLDGRLELSLAAQAVGEDASYAPDLEVRGGQQDPSPRRRTAGDQDVGARLQEQIGHAARAAARLRGGGAGAPGAWLALLPPGSEPEFRCGL